MSGQHNGDKLSEIEKLPKEIQAVIDRLAIESPPMMGDIAATWAEFASRLDAITEDMKVMSKAYQDKGNQVQADKFSQKAVNASTASELFGKLLIWYTQIRMMADKDRSDLHGAIAKCQKLAIALTVSEAENKRLKEQLESTL